MEPGIGMIWIDFFLLRDVLPRFIMVLEGNKPAGAWTVTLFIVQTDYADLINKMAYIHVQEGRTLRPRALAAPLHEHGPLRGLAR